METKTKFPRIPKQFKQSILLYIIDDYFSLLIYCADNPHHWETVVRSPDRRAWLSKCSGLVTCGLYQTRWHGYMNALHRVMNQEGVGQAFGIGPARDRTNRRSAFFSRNCTCGYVFTGSAPRPGIPFPKVLLDICKLVMPIVGIYDEARWPTGANVTWYRDGSVFY